MALFVTTITGDFENILGLLFLLVTTCGYGWSRISLSYGGARSFALSLAAFFLFFFPDLLERLLGLGALFGLIGLTLALALGGCAGFLLSFF